MYGFFSGQKYILNREEKRKEKRNGEDKRKIEVIFKHISNDEHNVIKTIKYMKYNIKKCISKFFFFFLLIFSFVT